MYIIKSFAILLAVAAIIYGYVVEVPYFSNTFGIRYLFFRGLFSGLILGGLLGFYLKNKTQNSIERIQIIVACVLAGMLICPLLVISSNHLLADDTPLSKTVIFEKEEALRTSRFGISKKTGLPEPDAYYVHLLIDNEPERIRINNSSFKNVAPGSEITLRVKKGFWGFDFVND